MSPALAKRARRADSADLTMALSQSARGKGPDDTREYLVNKFTLIGCLLVLSKTQRPRVVLLEIFRDSVMNTEILVFV